MGLIFRQNLVYKWVYFSSLSGTSLPKSYLSSPPGASKPAKLKCNILFKKNGKYILDVHCSVRIRILYKMTLNKKPLLFFFLGGAFAPIPVSAAPNGLSGNTVGRYFSVFLKGLKIFLNPRLSLIVPCKHVNSCETLM